MADVIIRIDTRAAEEAITRAFEGELAGKLREFAGRRVDEAIAKLIRDRATGKGDDPCPTRR